MPSTQVNVMRSEPYITISLSIPSKLLAQVELLEGKNLNEKILKCVEEGFKVLKR